MEVETVRPRETNVVRSELENLSVLTNVIRFVPAVAMTHHQETIVAMVAVHVGVRVVDLEIRMRMNRVDESRGVVTILVQVRRIVMTAVDAGVVLKRRQDLIDG
jgi:hypothetical protein